MHLTKVEVLLSSKGIGEMPPLDIFVKETGALNIAEWQPKGALSFYTYKGFCDVSKDHENKARDFLKYVQQNNASLALTPEYSFPLSALQDMVSSEEMWPTAGKLWCLCMEGMSADDYNSFFTCLEGYENVVAIRSEPLVKEKFYNTLVYVFRSYQTLVLISQLKTQPARDVFNEIEGSNMCIGDSILVFHTEDNSKVFASFICADVLSEGIDLINISYPQSDTLVFVPQLNPASMHDSFTDSIKKMLYFSLRARVIFLNWAENTFISDPRASFVILHGLSAFITSETKAGMSTEHIKRNQLQGMCYCSYEHLSIWYSTNKECLVVICILPLRRGRHHAALDGNHEPTISNIYPLGQPNSNTCWCSIDWDWLDSTFGIRSCYSEVSGCTENQCMYVNIIDFVNSFSYESALKPHGITVDKFYSPAAQLPKTPDGRDNEWIQQQRERLGYIFALINRGSFPRRFANLKRNYKWEMHRPGINMTTLEKKKGLNDALLIFIDLKSNAKRIISKVMSIYGTDGAKRLLLCYSTDNGYAYLDDMKSKNIAKGESIVDYNNITNGSIGIGG